MIPRRGVGFDSVADGAARDVATSVETVSRASFLTARRGFPRLVVSWGAENLSGTLNLLTRVHFGRTSMHRSLPVIATLLGLGVASCEPAPTPDQAPQGPTRADSVGMALQAFDATIFDTIAWESETAANDRGALVFRVSCDKCHGLHGAGDGGFVFQGDTLRPPSFLAPEWVFADEPTQLRRYIFSGNVAGMPYWGLVGLKYKDIDAVARFISGPLRAGISQP